MDLGQGWHRDKVQLTPIAGGLVSSTFLRNHVRWQAQTQKLRAEVGSRLAEVDSGEAKLIGSCDVVGGVINKGLLLNTPVRRVGALSRRSCWPSISAACHGGVTDAGALNCGSPPS
jgi:hypothetical protein